MEEVAMGIGKMIKNALTPGPIDSGDAKRDYDAAKERAALAPYMGTTATGTGPGRPVTPAQGDPLPSAITPSTKKPSILQRAYQKAAEKNKPDTQK